MRMLLYLLVIQWTAMKSTRGDRDFLDATGKIITDINSFCKNKPCIAKYCTEPNAILVKNVTTPQHEMKCQTLEELKNFTKMVFNIFEVDEVYKWEHATYEYLELTNKSLLTDFQYITLNNSEEYQKSNNVEIRFNQNCKVLEDGSVSLEEIPHQIPRFEVQERGTFMVDFFITAKYNSTLNKTLCTKIKKRCVILPKDDEDDTLYDSIGMLVSSFFLAVVFIIYCMLPQLRTWPGPVIMAYTASFKITFTLIAAMNLLSNNDSINGHGCQIVSIICYFFTLATFFWLNVMVFDIFWRFRGSFKALTSDRSEIKRRFYICCLYGFGGPLLITIAVTIIDIEVEDKNVLKPLFSDCMHGGKNYLLFIHAPMVVLMFVNFIFFVMTTYNIRRINKVNDQVTRSSESKKNRNRNNGLLILKLSMVTGFYWIFEIIIEVQSNKVVTLILRTYVALTGVLIFVVFICRKSVLKPLCLKLSIFPEYTASLRNNSTSKSVSKTLLSSKRSGEIERRERNERKQSTAPSLDETNVGCDSNSTETTDCSKIPLREIPVGSPPVLLSCKKK